MNAMTVTRSARRMVALAVVAFGCCSLPALAEDPIATVDYACKEGKTIKATFYNASVDLVLGNGKKMSLPQAQSADGGRYATADESFVFWAVGDKAFVTEGDPNVQTYADCVGKRQ
ncbi:MAG: MliC family protein [Rhizobiales bacterium]|nr:MliC family protein [Hyphomicrobiales bacterium]